MVPQRSSPQAKSGAPEGSQRARGCCSSSPVGAVQGKRQPDTRKGRSRGFRLGHFNYEPRSVATRQTKTYGAFSDLESPGTRFQMSQLSNRTRPRKGVQQKGVQTPRRAKLIRHLEKCNVLERVKAARQGPVQSAIECEKHDDPRIKRHHLSEQQPSRSSHGAVGF